VFGLDMFIEILGEQGSITSWPLSITKNKLFLCCFGGVQ
jgi:hypothetical protein